MRTLLCFFSLVLPLALQAATTGTATPNATSTATPYSSPTPTATQPVPTGTATQAPALSPTRTAPAFTASRTPTPALSQTATPTPSPTPSAVVTAPPAGTPIPQNDGRLDDFETGDLHAIRSGSWAGATDGGGSTLILGPVPGCPYGSTLSALRCHGSCSGVPLLGWASAVLAYPEALDASLPAGRSRSLAFRVRASSSGLTLTVSVGSGPTEFAAQVYVAPGPWRDITIALPDNEVPGDLPQLAFVSGVPSWSAVVAAVDHIAFTVQAPDSGGLAYDFEVDDLVWGAYPGGCSPSQMASAFSVSLSDVLEAQSFGLSGRATWYLLVLSRHCGCHPSEVLAHRATMSWGEIAELYGLTWVQLTDEAWDLAEAAGLELDGDSMDQVLQDLRNGPPSTAPVPTVTPYVPIGPLALPPAGGC